VGLREEVVLPPVVQEREREAEGLPAEELLVLEALACLAQEVMAYPVQGGQA
jgi:hypothetical protein